jgi:hypothetical protein
MNKFVSIVMTTTAAVAVAAIQSHGEHASDPVVRPRFEAAAAPAPLPLPPGSPTRAECAKLFDFSRPALSRADELPWSTKNATPLAPGARALPRANSLLPADAASLKKPDGDADHEESREPRARGASPSGTPSGYFPRKIYRLASAGVKVGNGKIRMSFRFDGITQTFSVETCAQNEEEQWPQVWKNYSARLNTLSWGDDSDLMVSRLPIILGSDNYDYPDQGLDPYTQYKLQFNISEIIAQRAKTMTVLFWNLETSAWETTPVAVWPLEQEYARAPGEAWPCEWSGADAATVGY